MPTTTSTALRPRTSSTVSSRSAVQDGHTASGTRAPSIVDVFAGYRPIPVSLVVGGETASGARRPRPPPLVESLPLTMFFHCDEHLVNSVRALGRLRRYPQTSRFRDSLGRIHAFQKLLLDAAFAVRQACPERAHTCRDYRQLLPAQDQRELSGRFSENILFAAQALTREFRIRGIETYTETLRESAGALCASFDALRVVFRSEAMRNPQPPYAECIVSVVRDFDRAWAHFEQHICYCYFSVAMDAQYDGGPNNSTHPSIGIDDKALFTVLLSETVLRALQREYFTIEDMHGYEPSLMFAIPRLSVVYGLLYAPEYLGLTETHVAIRWLRDVSGSKVKLLHEIQSDLRNLTEDEVHALERMITVESSVSSSDVDDLAATPALRDVYRAIAAIADDMQTGARAKEFVGILGQLFEMYSNKQEDDGSAEGTVEQARVSVEQSMQVAQRHRSTSKNPLRHLFLAVTGRLRSQSTEDETPAVASR